MADRVISWLGFCLRIPDSTHCKYLQVSDAHTNPGTKMHNLVPNESGYSLEAQGNSNKNHLISLLPDQSFSEKGGTSKRSKEYQLLKSLVAH